MTALIAPGAPLAVHHAPAPAKINLYLHVLGRRDDGYHELETVFDLLDWSDTLQLAGSDDAVIERVGAHPGIAADDDLTLRAARALREAAMADAAADGDSRERRATLGVRIALRKRLPIGGGVGGGSSDAATVLLVLNRLWQLRWSPERLASVATALGADVPVFVHGRPAYARGIGERLQPLPPLHLHYVVVAPPATVATAAVFGAVELTRNSKPIKISGSSISLRPGELRLPGRNDLEPVVLALHPTVHRARQALLEAVAAAGASASRTGAVVATTAVGAGRPSTRKDTQQAGAQVRMTGSGACVFAIASSDAQARAIASRLVSKGVGEIIVTRSLPEHPLRRWSFAPDGRR